MLHLVPLVTLGTVAGVFLSPRNVRVARNGLGLLAALLFTMVVLGRFTA